MGFKGLFAATVSVALMATPTLASAQVAAPSSEMVSGMQLSDEEGPNLFVILGAVVAIALFVWVLLDDDDDDEEPISP